MGSFTENGLKIWALLYIQIDHYTKIVKLELKNKFIFKIGQKEFTMFKNGL